MKIIEMLLILTFASVLLSFNSSAEINWWVSQNITGINWVVIGSSSNYLGAQSFKLSATNSVNRAQFYVHDIVGEANFDMFFTIETDNSGTPSGVKVNSNANTTVL